MMSLKTNKKSVCHFQFAPHFQYKTLTHAHTQNKFCQRLCHVGSPISFVYLSCDAMYCVYGLAALKDVEIE